MTELGKEIENGRLLRLAAKLGFVNERPDLLGDTQWADTGDRYLLRLFRDHVFHQTSKDGAPMLDWGHVIECLNKVCVYACACACVHVCVRVSFVRSRV